MSARRSPTIFDSFNYAFEGLIHVLRTQRNMRVHFAYTRAAGSTVAEQPPVRNTATAR